MKLLQELALAGGIAATLLAPHAVANEPFAFTPQLSWGLSFGSQDQGVTRKLALSLGSAGADTRVAEFDLFSGLRVAGIALWQPSYRVSQSGDDDVPLENVSDAMAETEEQTIDEPWYSETWVWLAGGGLVAAAALAGAGGGDDDPASSQCAGDCDGNDGPDVLSVNGGTVCVIDDGGGPAPDACASAPFLGSAAAPFASVLPAVSLDEGTGQMGDLFAR